MPPEPVSGVTRGANLRQKGTSNAMPARTDRRDAEKIARLLRLGWFGSIHCKSISAQEGSAVLAARESIQNSMTALETSLRGLPRNFGQKVGAISRGGSLSNRGPAPDVFSARDRDLGFP